MPGEFVRICPFACREMDVFIDDFTAFLVFESVHRLYEKHLFGTYRYRPEYPDALTIVNNIPAMTVRTANFLRTGLYLKQDCIIFVTCSSAHLASEAECLVHKAGIHISSICGYFKDTKYRFFLCSIYPFFG